MSKSKRTGNETVITISGAKEPISNCRKINGTYHKIGNINIKDSGDCYPVETENGVTYYRKNNPNLIWDYYLQKYCIKTNQINGYVDYEEGIGFISGFFTPNIFDNIRDSQYIYLNKDVLKKARYVFDSFSNTWGRKNNNNRRELISLGINEGIRKVNYQTFNSEVYNSSEHSFFSQMQEMFDKWSEENFQEHPFDKFFRQFTIGVEIETSAGNIPENELYRLGLLPLKDGSIAGHEFTSVIIKEKYFDIFKNMFFAASDNCTVNKNTSLHYHFGNIKKTKEFVVAFWILFYRLQEEMESLCPPYKRDLMFLTNKRVGSGRNNGVKDHCKRLPNLFNGLEITDVNQAFEKILLFLNEGHPTQLKDKRLIYAHCKTGRPKWDFESRYYAVNLIPFLFESKQTIEFRYHSGTVNFYKAFAWALICSALLQYAELNIERILEGKEKIRLTDIIKVFNDDSREGKFIFTWLTGYINLRSMNYQTNIIKHEMFGDEFTNDNTFSFKIEDRQGITCPLTFK